MNNPTIGRERECKELIAAVGDWLTAKIAGEDVTELSKIVRQKRQQLIDAGMSAQQVNVLEQTAVHGFAYALAESIMQVTGTIH